MAGTALIQVIVAPAHQVPEAASGGTGRRGPGWSRRPASRAGPTTSALMWKSGSGLKPRSLGSSSMVAATRVRRVEQLVAGPTGPPWASRSCPTRTADAASAGSWRRRRAGSGRTRPVLEVFEAVAVRSSSTPTPVGSGRSASTTSAPVHARAAASPPRRAPARPGRAAPPISRRRWRPGRRRRSPAGRRRPGRRCVRPRARSPPRRTASGPCAAPAAGTYSDPAVPGVLEVGPVAQQHRAGAIRSPAVASGARPRPRSRTVAGGADAIGWRRPHQYIIRGSA